MPTFRFQAEVRLVRWGESSSAGRTITLELPPDAGEGHPFKGFPAGHSHGQRFRMQFDAIGDDEQPAPQTVARPQEPNRGTPTLPQESAGRHRYQTASPAEQAVTRAALLSRDQRFQAWVSTRWQAVGVDIATEEEAADFIRTRCCDGNSRRLIADVPEYRDRFLTIETEFKIAVGELAGPR